MRVEGLSRRKDEVLTKVTRTVGCFGVYRVCHHLDSRVLIIKKRQKYISVDLYLFNCGEILRLLFFSHHRCSSGPRRLYNHGSNPNRVKIHFLRAHSLPLVGCHNLGSNPSREKDLLFSDCKIESGCNQPSLEWLPGMIR